MIYKTVAQDKKTNEYVIIESDYPTKANFIKDIRANGYRVNDLKVKIKEVFDYIIDHTNAEKIDWKKYNKIEDLKNI